MRARWIINFGDVIVEVTAEEWRGFMNSMNELTNAWDRAMLNSESRNYWLKAGGQDG